MAAAWQRYALPPLRDLAHPPAQQLPGLDFLRAWAILLVVFGHLTVEYVASGGTPSFFSALPWVRGGWIGVDLFFVLSGLLIGRQLWQEAAKTGRVDFRRFCLRRGYRIWPLYFFFWIVVALGLGGAGVPLERGWSDLVFLTNYFNHGIVMGSWSLCVEEQFYLIAPVAVGLLAVRVPDPATQRRILIGALLLLPLTRAGIWWWVTGGLESGRPEAFRQFLYQPIHTHADGLVMGLLLAHLWHSGEMKKQRFLTSGWCLGLSAAVFLAFRKAHNEILDFSGLSLVWGAATCFLLGHPGFLPRLIVCRVFHLLSRLSFGMYLNHEYLQKPVAELALRFIPFAGELAPWHNILTGWLLVLVSAAVATVTYCAVEHPFLELRRRKLEAGSSRTEPR
ncbi:MAG: acyltransferase family protein [Armatimonadota bacterium]